jgi:hypothetical protein
LSFERARQLVEDAVARHIEAWAEIIGLANTSPQLPQFRKDVTEALYACVHLHFVVQQFPRFTRTSDIRRNQEEIARAAKSLARKLQGYNKKLEGTLCKGRALAAELRDFSKKHSFPSMVFHIGRIFDPIAAAQDLEALPSLNLIAPAQDFEALASMTKQIAEACKDKGGSKMQAFETLAIALIQAYRRATNRRGTGRSARDGDLLDLAEAVLPVAHNLAKHITGKSFRAPAVERGLGDYLHRLCRLP